MPRRQEPGSVKNPRRYSAIPIIITPAACQSIMSGTVARTVPNFPALATSRESPTVHPARAAATAMPSKASGGTSIRFLPVSTDPTVTSPSGICATGETRR